MGGCWSGWRSEAEIERAKQVRYAGKNQTIVINNVISNGNRGASRFPQRNYVPQRQACYGEYNCPCGRFWSSTLSWSDKYKVCKRCRKHVYPRNQRAVRQTDIKRGALEHPRDLCQMCRELGRYCGSSNQKSSFPKFTNRR